MYILIVYMYILIYTFNLKEFFIVKNIYQSFYYYKEYRFSNNYMHKHFF